MRVKENRRKPIIFGNPREILAVVLMYYFSGNLVFGLLESNTEFCRRRWSEFVNDRKSWEEDCLKDTKMSPCCEAMADYLEHSYDNYIKYCPIVGTYSLYVCLIHALSTLNNVVLPTLNNVVLPTLTMLCCPH